MQNVFYYPPLKAQYPAWYSNFMRYLRPEATRLGLSKETVDALDADEKALDYVNKGIDDYKKILASFILTRTTLLEGDMDNPNLKDVPYPVLPVVGAAPAAVMCKMYDRHKSLVLILRENPLMNPDLANNLGIQPKPVAKIDPDTYEPKLAGSVTIEGYAKLSVAMKGFKAYEIWRATGKDGQSIKIGISFTADFIDQTPVTGQSGLRTYKVRMIDKTGNPTGLYSNVLTLGVL